MGETLEVLTVEGAIVVDFGFFATVKSLRRIEFKKVQISVIQDIDLCKSIRGTEEERVINPLIALYPEEQGWLSLDDDRFFAKPSSALSQNGFIVDTNFALRAYDCDRADVVIPEGVTSLRILADKLLYVKGGIKIKNVRFPESLKTVGACIEGFPPVKNAKYYFSKDTVIEEETTATAEYLAQHNIKIVRY
jgi:hypothetical protein